MVDFYRCVFDAQNAEAVKDFVTEDYSQHARYMATGLTPTGRAGLEASVRANFPDGPRPVQSEPALPLTILVAEGNIVVFAASLPQPEPDDPSKRYPYFLYNAFRIRDGKIAEHWGGVNKAAPPAPPKQ